MPKGGVSSSSLRMNSKLNPFFFVFFVAHAGDGTYRTETKDGFGRGSMERKDIGDGQNPTKFKPALITTFALFG